MINFDGFSQYTWDRTLDYFVSTSIAKLENAVNSNLTDRHETFTVICIAIPHIIVKALVWFSICGYDWSLSLCCVCVCGLEQKKAQLWTSSKRRKMFLCHRSVDVWNAIWRSGRIERVWNQMMLICKWLCKINAAHESSIDTFTVE